MRALLEQFSKRKIEVLFGPLTFCSGILLRYRRHWFCVINTRKAFVHQRFTLAHELYHFDHHRHLAQLFPVYSTSTSSLEREANRGAADMLMPTDRVTAYINALWAKPRDLAGHLARVFRVSRQAMEIRLEELGIRR